MYIQIILFVIVTQVLCSNQLSEEKRDPLYLTPYLEDGRLGDAKKLSEVHINKTFLGYSGFLNVNKNYDSQMFFWYVPPDNLSPNAPVILWLQGGPGLTGLFGFFVLHGPIQYENETCVKRNVSWNREYHVIYVDNPVGAGYSHTSSDEAYSTDMQQVAHNLHTFILQFFKMFPELQYNDFYLAGESYAGKYVPVLINTIHERNAGKVVVNLKGGAIGNPLIDPPNQISYGKYFYSYGLIDENGILIFNQMERECIEHATNKRWRNASIALQTMLCGDYRTEDTPLFRKLTAFDQCSDIIQGEPDVNHYSFLDMLEVEEFQDAIHVGDANFTNFGKAAMTLTDDIVKSVAEDFIEALNHYRIIVYIGQMDVIVPYPLVSGMIDKLNFSSSEEWASAERHVWLMDDTAVGTYKSAGNLTLVMVYDAKHSTALHQPERTFEIIKKLTSNKPFE